jgi:carbamoyl-phosphate synthase large subunit
LLEVHFQVKRNVLVFPAGTEIGLEIFHALQSCKEVRLFGAGQDLSNHALFVYPEYYVLPSIYEKGWVDALIDLCRTLSIDYIFPAYDDVIVALSREAHRLPAKIISSPPRTCEITRSKSDTYRALSGKVRVPQLYSSSDAVFSYPVLVKPDRGQGSFGITKADDEQALVRALQAVREPIICEYLSGEEYTIDCFSDRDKGLLFAGARRRRRTRNGISVNTITEALPEAKEMANNIGHELNLRGAWFFQLKRAHDGQLVLLEVSPRIAGSMATHRVKGVNFPLLSIFEEERLPISVKPNEGIVELDRALGNRYRHTIRYSVLYVDLDDTLLVNGRVNTQVVKLLFQCINDGKKIILLTRHREDLNQTLARYRLSGLFDEVIHLGADEKKFSRIESRDAIFVDDSFAERMDVSERHNIPTFDCSMIEMLTEQAELLNGDGNA